MWGKFLLKGMRLASIGTFLFVVLHVAAARCGDKPIPEYKLKAAVMFNILKFVHWPAANAPGSMISIGILGRDPFGEYGEELIKKTLDRRTVAVLSADRLRDLKDCHVLFIARSEAPRIREILRSPVTKGKILMGDTEGFGKAGVHFNLLVRDRRIHIEINHHQAKKEGVRISSQLLKLGEVIGP